MKVILIEEDRFNEILEKLEYETESMIAKETSPDKEQVIRDTHRRIHYSLVKWMQSHGVS